MEVCGDARHQKRTLSSTWSSEWDEKGSVETGMILGAVLAWKFHYSRGDFEQPFSLPMTLMAWARGGGISLLVFVILQSMLMWVLDRLQTLRKEQACLLFCCRRGLSRWKKQG
uniref:Uncharacterized protein n=1 Tax=Grammatophora oceanica TaxID=210454 RepID=A0A7S1Y0I8_9STRA|mmetsp:Transcript_12170/g.17850  ORF Transcript_12170/g.17850 Transcript_12170/m.17850 type:complete len:113 (+) Transcript_12170:224-562(+)